MPAIENIVAIRNIGIMYWESDALAKILPFHWGFSLMFQYHDEIVYQKQYSKG